MPTIIDGSASATFATPLPLLQGGTGNTSGNVSSSQVAGALNASGSAPLFACRAWVNFNGTGTVAIRASGNVSSITDNAVGDYTVNFTTALEDANYSVTGTAGNADGALRFIASAQLTVPTTTASRVLVANAGGTALDAVYVSTAIFR